MKYYNIRCGGWYAQEIWRQIGHQALSILQTKDSGGRRNFELMASYKMLINVTQGQKWSLSEWRSQTR